MHNFFEAKGQKLEASRAESGGQASPLPTSYYGVWGSAISSPGGVWAKSRPQTHFGVF